MITWNSNINRFETTCEKCKEVSLYKTSETALRYKELCFFCQKYDIIKVSDTQWTYPCPKCGCTKCSPSRRAAIQAIKDKDTCHACRAIIVGGMKIEQTKLKYEGAGIKPCGNKFFIVCPKCNTPLLYSSEPIAYAAWVQKQLCEACTMAQQAEINILQYTNTEEVWKRIFDFNYEVSNLGRVRNKQTLYLLKILPQGINGAYAGVILYKNNKAYPKYVHRLVMDAFSDTPPKPKAQIKHIDGNLKNNVFTNLKWLYPSCNQFVTS